MDNKRTLAVAREPGKLVETIAGRAYEGRSKLYRWIRANYAELAEARRLYAPTWQALTDVARDAGQTDRKGDPPSATAFRRVFLRVERDLAGKSAPASAPVPAGADRPPSPLASRSPPASLPLTASQPEDEGRKPGDLLRSLGVEFSKPKKDSTE